MKLSVRKHYIHLTVKYVLLNYIISKIRTFKKKKKKKYGKVYFLTRVVNNKKQSSYYSLVLI